MLDDSASLDEEDTVAVLYTPVASANPVLVSNRDRDKLQKDVVGKLSERSKIFQKSSLSSPVRRESAGLSTQTLSSIAQKFMKNSIAKSSQSIDESLRASYHNSSPGLSTPKSGRSLSKLGRDDNMTFRSPSVREGSNPPW
ncbi:Hypothetical predicted protein [Olea europaea subsp. europaea]|uniref:Uncharacterized protein n=1 Tax=Olea europaea subsp. europaea TaxID=158383 RepID=A0A8S0QEF4_OLEEU|nr:Hypothetical predicted protein [Olea europaea subsp. europaea]